MLSLCVPYQGTLGPIYKPSHWGRLLAMCPNVRKTIASARKLVLFKAPPSARAFEGDISHTDLANMVVHIPRIMGSPRSVMCAGLFGRAGGGGDPPL